MNTTFTLLARARFRRPEPCRMLAWFDAQDRMAAWRANVDAFDRLGVTR